MFVFVIVIVIGIDIDFGIIDFDYINEFLLIVKTKMKIKWLELKFWSNIKNQFKDNLVVVVVVLWH